MKKWILVTALVLICALSVLPASAAGSDDLPDGCFATASELFGYWESTYPAQYPDYICGVWTDNGTVYPLTFSLTDDAVGKAGKKEILRLLADDNSVKFTTGKYSRNYLMQVMDDISQYFTQNLGLVGLGVYDMQNHVGVEIDEDYINREDTQKLLADLKARYGDAVSITYTSGYVTYTLDIMSGMTETADVYHKSESAKKQMILLCCAVGIGLLGTTAFLAILRGRKTAAAQTEAGTVTVTATATRKPTRREVEKAIQNSESSPPPELEQKIRDRLGQ